MKYRTGKCHKYNEYEIFPRYEIYTLLNLFKKLLFEIINIVENNTAKIKVI